MTKLLAIDWGGKRVGLALTDTVTRLPQSLITLVNNDQLVTELKAVCHREAIDLVLVGLPLGLDGQETAQTSLVRAWGQKLKTELALPIKFQAETLTTVVAKDRQEVDLDSGAAVIMLQDYLSEHE